MKFLEFSKAIGEGISPVYLAEGNETYFREKVVELLQEKCVTERMMNDTRYEGEELKGDKLRSFIDNLSVLPFFSEYRLVRVYEFYPSEKEFETYLKPYLSNPCPTTVLCIVNVGKKGVDLKRKGGITYIDCSKEKEEVVGKWLFGMLRRSGLSSDTDAVQRMVSYCSCDCARLKKEVEKLRDLLGNGGVVTAQIVEEQIVKDVEYKIYELTQSAGRRASSSFFEILNDLLKKGYDEHAVLSSLCGYYRTMYEVTSMRGSDGEIASALGLKPFAVQKNREQAQRIGLEKVKRLYCSLYALSCGAKDGTYNKENALSRAIAEIFFSD